MFFGRNSERGQILLVVILASVVALTVGLAAVSRTITSTKVTTEEQNSQKALSAAEAGVEELTNNASYASGATGNKTLSNNSSFNSTSVVMNPVSPYVLNGGNPVSKDDGADIWLSKYPDYSLPWSGTLTVYWQKFSDADCLTKESAVEIVVLTGSVNSPNMNRYAVDRCAGVRGNGFISTSSPSFGSSTIGGVAYNSYTIPPIPPASPGPGIIARVIPLYNDTKVAIGFTGALPSQGTIITSTGASGETKRTIQVVKGFPRVPIELFPYNIFLPK